jgi:YndJ-like protein
VRSLGISAPSGRGGSIAPLVIIPLGMELGRGIGGGWCEELARRLQPAGATLAVVAICLPPGRRAAIVSAGWMVICLLMAGGRGRQPGSDCVERRGRGRPRDIDRDQHRTHRSGGGRGVAGGVAAGDAADGNSGTDRTADGRALSLAGFATATIAARTLQFAERRGEYRWLKPVVGLVAGLPIVVAVGFVVSPAVKMVAAILFSGSVAGLAIAVRACGREAENATARVLLEVAAGAVFASMVLSAAYAVANFARSDVLTIPQMARTHGILNAVGFCLLGILGCLVEWGDGA